MDLGDWIGLFFALAPVWAAVGYGLLRLTGLISKPEGLPPGRTGGMGRLGAAGFPLSDAPAYGRELNRKKAEEEAEAARNEAPETRPPDPGPAPRK
ncbi:MAG: hypothetical protein M3323_09165 [Actinomycetota bacterium]|nr:hypothetical protein [Actinomycetota bacterium]